MALTTRVNGRTPASQINASWFNDFNDLLTGTMKDQLIKFTRNLTLQALGSAPGTFTTAVVAGSGLGIGVYTYTCTLVCSDGETVNGSTPGATTTSGNQKVNLSSLPIGPAGTTARNIYRTLVGGSTYHLLATINDNTTTTYVDTTPDATISSAASPPTHGSFGGALIINNYAGTPKAAIYSNDGAVSFDAGQIISDGGGNLSFLGNGSFAKMGRDGSGNFFIDNPSGTRRVAISSAGATSFSASAGVSITGPLTGSTGVFTGAMEAASYKNASGGPAQIAVYDNGTGTLRTITLYEGTTDPTTYATVNEGDWWLKG